MDKLDQFQAIGLFTKNICTMLFIYYLYIILLCILYRNGEKIIEGEIPSVNDRMFNSGVIKIKCESKYDDFVLKNEELNLGKELTVYDNNNPSRHSQRPGYNPGFNPGGNNGIGQLPRDSRVYDNEIIHRY